MKRQKNQLNHLWTESRDCPIAMKGGTASKWTQSLYLICLDRLVVLFWWFLQDLWGDLLCAFLYRLVLERCTANLWLSVRYLWVVRSLIDQVGRLSLLGCRISGLIRVLFVAGGFCYVAYAFALLGVMSVGFLGLAQFAVTALQEILFLEFFWRKR